MYRAVVPLFAKDDSLTVFKQNGPVVFKLLIDNGLMRFIVKNHTVLQHLYHRGPLKAIGRLKHIHTKLQFTIDGSRKKKPSGSKGQLPGTKRLLHRSKRRALRNKPMLGGR